MFDWNQIFGRKQRKTDGIRTLAQSFEKELRKLENINVLGVRELNQSITIDFAIGEAEINSSVSFRKNRGTAMLRFPRRGKGSGFVEPEDYIHILPEKVLKNNNEYPLKKGNSDLSIRKNGLVHIILHIENDPNAINHIKDFTIRTLKNYTY